ncbi:MAG TPA: hypothetical protein VGN26_04080 [Armatimonadota bacterium]|jgi:hypothetical protein
MPRTLPLPLQDHLRSVQVVDWEARRQGRNTTRERIRLGHTLRLRWPASPKVRRVQR